METRQQPVLLLRYNGHKVHSYCLYKLYYSKVLFLLEHNQ